MSKEFVSAEQKVSYGIGRQLGNQLASNQLSGLDVSALAAGIADALDNAPSAVSPEEFNVAYESMSRIWEKEKQSQYQGVIAEGEAFLAKNAERPEVSVTDSGLQYEVLQAGEGEKPLSTSQVVTHYRGSLIDGTVFDSSYDRGEPAEFPVNGVISGWQEALQLMSVGEKWRLYVPYQLAYGERGAGESIPPYSTLVFDVELLSVLATA